MERRYFGKINILNKLIGDGYYGVIYTQIACNNLLILFAVIAMTGIVCSKFSDILRVPDVVLF